MITSLQPDEVFVFGSNLAGLHGGGHPGKRFLLTKVGCGIAGYPESTMRALFTNPPANLILPEDWRVA
ncbi:hypothetical protein UFOVP130_71 [uncultured Caudovirales phage]|uniref:Uncharacterized protein n=1 Tax=uncultured Caudovirales phage TaxID=2100421 RepID=A0A6J5LD30_9CAUD|nr:hypothetical protein UFOVP130_71 [uncultured Caudovirales phage]